MLAGDGAGIVAAGGQAEQARRVALHALDRAAQHDVPPLASMCPSSASMKPWLSMMPVEGESERANAGDLRLQRARRVAADRLEVGDAVLGRRLPDGGELGELALRCRHQQLAAARVRHVVLGAEGVEQLLAAHAQRGAQAARRIVDAGVDHLAVARARLRADQGVLLQHHRLVAGQGQRARHGQPDGAGPDDNGLHVS